MWMNKQWLERPHKKIRARLELLEWLDSINNSNIRAYMVTQGQKQLGAAILDKIDWIARHAWMYIIHDDEDFETIVSAALKQAAELNLKKVSIDVLLEQTSQVDILERLGFKIEVRKRQFLLRRGNYKTILEMAKFVGSHE